MKKKLSHRLLSFLLVALMICNMLPISILAAESQQDNAVTVYMTAMNQGEFVTNGALNTTWALEEVTVPYFDLALYGLEGLYYNPDCYSGGDKILQEAGTAETAEGVVTILHLFIWVTEVYYHGLDVSEAGQGALAHELDWDGFEVYDQTPGSAFIYFWEYGSNLNYYVNYEYPLAYIGWGATLDQIALKDGDVVSVRYNMDMGSEELDGRYYHFGSKGDVSKTTTQANDVVLTLYKCAHSLDYSTGHERQGEGLNVYVSAIPVMEAESAEAVYTTNKNGQVTVETSTLEPGTYYVFSDTFDPAVMTLTVKAPEHVCSYEPVVTPPTCEEEGYTTYTCSCGDSYESDFVPAIGHSYENGICTGCGDVKNVIPEGARYINVTTDVDGVCVVEDQGLWTDYGMEIPYYHLVIPEDAQYVYITYPENCLCVSQWSYAAAYEMPLPYSWDTPGRNIEPQAVTNADGSQTISIAVKDYITQIPNDGKGIIMYNQNFNFGEMFTIGRQIEEGYYDVSIPTSERYTVTGETVAKDGYTFSVSINDGYLAGEEFAVKVNGEALTPNEDGSYTVSSVNERLIITVVGVRLAPREPNVFITVDLTDYDGVIDSNTTVSYEGPDIEWTYTRDHGLVPGESKTYQFHSDEIYTYNICLCLPYNDGAILGWDVNGTKCLFTGSYKQYDLPAETSDDAVGYLQRITYGDYDFLQFECGIGYKTWDIDEPGTWVFKPIMADDLIAATAISLDKSELTLTVGEEETLNATVTPENTTDSIVWASSNTAVATVNNGKVTAVAAGEATITVTAGEYTAVCAVTVEAKAEEDPGQSDYPFTVTVGGEVMTEYTIGEVSTAYNGTVPLYTVTIPEGTTEVTITWNDGNNYTLSYYDANGGYLGFESGMQNSWTVAMDMDSDGAYDNVEVYDSGWSVPYWITFTNAVEEEPEEPAAPFTVTVGGEVMTEYTIGEVSTAYNGTVPLYTVTIPEGTTEVTITWNDGNNYTLSYYNANGGYIGFESGMQNSWTVAMDMDSDGAYDNVEVYDSSWSVPYWITFANPVEEEPEQPTAPFTVTVGGEVMTEFVIGEINTPYTGTKALYTVTIPEGTTEVTITWNDGNNYTMSYYDANCNYFGFEASMQNSWTVAMDKNGDGEYDNLEIYDSGYGVPYWITFANAAEEEPELPESSFPYTVTVDGESIYAKEDGTEWSDVAYTEVVKYTATVPANTTAFTISGTSGMMLVALADPNNFLASGETSCTVNVSADAGYLIGNMDTGECYHLYITFEEAEEPEEPAAPFTVTVGGEAMTEFVIGEINDPYSGTVPLYTVTIPEGTTEVNITWNDGNNYTMSYYDTNCNYFGFEASMQNSWTVAMDKNSDGAYDYLQIYDSGYGVPYWITFASVVTHTHSYESVVTAPTCTEGGYTTYTCECGESYVADETAAKGHDYESVVTAPTCTEGGYTTYTCACGDSYVADETEAMGHNYAETKVEATCVSIGYTLYTCEACGASYADEIVNASGHKTVSVVTEPTHDAMGYTTTSCESCDYEFIHSWTDALDHEYVKSVTKEASCTENGEAAFKCVCGASYTQTLPMTGHSCEVTAIAASCTAYGYTSHQCKNCDFSYINDLVNPVGHKETVINAKAAGGHEDGYTGDTVCSVCKAELKKGEVIKANGCASASFTDISEKDWFHEAADYVVENKLMNGTSDTTFAPNAETTRAMMATLLYRLAGEPSIEGAVNPFEDVAEGQWYYNAVVWAAKIGIVSGTSKTTFDPNAMVTREQMVTMLWRFADQPVADKAELKGYADAKDISAYAENAFAWAIGQGLVTGTSETQLSPVGTATRAQIAIILMRYLSK